MKFPTKVANIKNLVSSNLTSYHLLTRLIRLRPSCSGVEYDPGPDGRITWSVGENPSWELKASAIGPNVAAEISQRPISQEPMVCRL